MNVQSMIPAVEHSEGPAPSGLECLIIVARQHGLHLTVTQLIHDNLLTDQEVTLDQLLKCAKSSGMTAKPVKLDWKGLRS